MMARSCLNPNLLSPAPSRATRHAVVEFVYQPRLRELHKGFTASLPQADRTIAFKAVLEAPEANQKIVVDVGGTAARLSKATSTTPCHVRTCR